MPRSTDEPMSNSTSPQSAVPSFASWRDHHQAIAGQQLSRLAAASSAGLRGRAHRLRRSYLNLRSSKIIASARALRGSPTIDEVAELASGIDPFSVHSDPVPWRWALKRSGRGIRPVCSLPPRLKAAHYLIQDILRAELPSSSRFFDIRGRGRDRQAREIAAAIDQGLTWCFVGDLTDCFQSVEANAFGAALPLPRSVIANCMDIRNLNMVLRNSSSSSGQSAPQWNGPRGLLQGSPASNLVLAWMLNDILDAIPPGARLFVFSDNILVATQSEQECRTIEHTLASFFGEHPAGPFQLRGGVQSLQTTIEHLGYAYSADCGLTIEPSHYGWERFSGRIDDAEERDFASGAVEPTESADVIRSFVSGYPAWANGPAWGERQMEFMKLFLPFPVERST